jgi:hypothetical protein
MRKITVFRGAAVMLALLVSTEAAQAWYVDYTGTRDEIRAACTAEGDLLWDDTHFTQCFTASGVTVFCYGGGFCRRTGERDISGGRGFRTRDYQPPQSLVDTGGSSNGSAVAPSTPSAPAPSAPTGPIFN